jgi:hypothetical protein
LCHLLIGESTEELDLAEPDFQVIRRPLKNNDHGIELLVFLDEGRSRSTGFSGQGVGLRLLVEQADLDKFAKEIRNQYTGLTKNLHRKK